MIPSEQSTVFYQIAAILLLASMVGFVTIRLKQPLIISFIIAGILVSSPIVPFDDVGPYLELLAGMGVTILLFLVGLKLDISMVKRMGKVSLATGLGQIVFTSGVGFALCRLLGMLPLTAFYVAVALTFSSTIIIVKLLSDKREIDSLHGQIAIGFLIVQDIFVILAMIFVSVFLSGDQSRDFSSIASSFAIRSAIFFFLFVASAKYILPRLLRSLARSPELLILFSISWAISLAALCHYLEFSKEIGAFLAGFSIASTGYREVVASRLGSLRDFLLLFFFIDLGASFEINLLGEQIGDAAILSLFVLIGNPLIVMAIMGLMGYRKRTGFLAGLTVAQISEFSLIFVALGVESGHLADTALGLVTLVGIVTISLSTYMILYSQNIFRLLGPRLGVFEKISLNKNPELEHFHSPDTPEVVLFGLGRYGIQLSRSLKNADISTLGVDFDPLAIERFRQAGVEARYGDAADFEYPETLPLAGAKWVISTIGDIATNRLLARALAHHGYSGKLALTVHRHAEAEALKDLRPSLILFPFADAAEKAMDQILKDLQGGGAQIEFREKRSKGGSRSSKK